MPAVVYYLSSPLPENYRLGLFIVSITPPALGSPIISDLIFGNTEFVVSKVIIYNLLSPFIFSFLPFLFFPDIANISTMYIIFLKVVTYIFIPLILALIVRQQKKIKYFFVDHVKIYSGILQLLMISIAISSSSKKIHEMEIVTVVNLFIATSLIALFLYSLGYLFCLKNKEMNSSCAISAGYKNTLLAMIVCLTNFSPVTALPSIFYLISHHILNGFLLQKAKKDI